MLLWSCKLVSHDEKYHIEMGTKWNIIFAGDVLPYTSFNREKYFTVYKLLTSIMQGDRTLLNVTDNTNILKMPQMSSLVTKWSEIVFL